VTVNEQMATAAQFRYLWTALMPNLQVPPSQQFLVWSGTYPPELVSRGINRATGKVRKMLGTATPMTSDDAMRYATSVMRNELLGVPRHVGNDEPKVPHMARTGFRDPHHGRR